MYPGEYRDVVHETTIPSAMNLICGTKPQPQLALSDNRVLHGIPKFHDVSLFINCYVHHGISIWGYPSLDTLGRQVPERDLILCCLEIPVVSTLDFLSFRCCIADQASGFMIPFGNLCYIAIEANP